MYNIKIALISIVLIITSACIEKPGEKAGRKAPLIKLEDDNYNFGDIEFGSDGTCEFVFTNSGKSPLLLTNIQSTCGCTVPEWPDEPINPGDTGVIRIKYDTYRVGAFNKSVTVYSNASNSPVRLFIKGRVKPKEEALS